MESCVTRPVRNMLVQAFVLMAFIGWNLPADAAKRPFSKPAAATQVKKCKKGEIWNKKKKTCIKAESGIVPDEDLLQQAGILADSGHYDWAIVVLASVQDKNDPDVLGLLGYSNRKAGRVEAGIDYYWQALALDPDMVRVREYLGEGYVSAGKLDLARTQLREIAARCGSTCREYLDLERAIANASVQ